MASCNGAHPSTSAMCTSSFNVGLPNSEEWNMISVSNASAIQSGFDRNCIDSFSVFAYGTEDGAFGPLSMPVCSICLVGQRGTSKCQDCSKILCNNCSPIHISQYTNHRIKNLADSPTLQSFPYPSSSFSLGSIHNGHSTGSPLPILCDKHREEALLFCLTCKILSCKDCSLQHGPLHSIVSLPEYIQLVSEENKGLLKEAEHGISIMGKRYDKCSELLQQMEGNEKEVVEMIVDTAKNFKILVEKRAQQLISDVHELYASKNSSLSRHQKIVSRNRCELQSMVKQLTYSLHTRKPFDLISVNKEVSVRLKAMQKSTSLIVLCENDNLEFFIPDKSLYTAIANFGILCNSGCACHTVASGRGKTRARTNDFNVVRVNVYDHTGNLCIKAPDTYGALSAHLLLSDGSIDGVCYVNWSEGAYVIRYMPRTDGIHHLHVKLRGHHIVGSPFKVSVPKPRDYKETGCPELVFGEEGGDDGQLCRPWGVCCDLDGNIIVADRSNNRVQIFRPDGTFYHKFGEQGSEPGQFDRPAGIATDIMYRIVVADKDNHRIQVFKTSGEFLFMFGEKGNKQGQFNYPWDVDVNSEGQIIVSDTRNHRIQLFSATGDFITKFGYENNSTMWKHFDSPRGVCFGHDGKVIVTDFNNHHIVVLDSLLSKPRYVGKGGCGPEELTRPQGICIDEYGHIIVADSRNNRIQIFEPNGSQLRHFGSVGKKPGELDRPSGICISPDGKIVVVDFGNNRIQVF